MKWFKRLSAGVELVEIVILLRASWPIAREQILSGTPDGGPAHRAVDMIDRAVEIVRKF